MKYLFLVICILVPLSLQKEEYHWALELDVHSLSPADFRALIEELEDKYHLIHKGRVGILDDVHKFHLTNEKLRSLKQKHDLSKDSSDEELVAFVHDFLASHEAVKVHHYQNPRERSKRTVAFNDPLFTSQWHLVNHQTSGHDIDVQTVWESGVTGRNVTVCVIDDGLDHSNADIRPNYNAKGSYDFISDDDDPMPLHMVSENHGTKCGGVIAAAANNGFCGVGVAYGATVSGVRILDSKVTDMREAEAFSYKLATNHIFSNSWGPTDDGKTVDGPGPLAQKVLRKASTKEGRCGCGSVYVVASGNGGQFGDNCNFDGYANSMYTATIGSITEDNKTPYYAEKCTTTLGVTYSSGMTPQRKITTTDLKWNSQGCARTRGGLTGTSASAPMAAGMIALMLDARWCLTWRDVQFIIVLTSAIIDNEKGWSKNGVGLMFHSYHGFGLMSATRMVNAAKVWKSVPKQQSWSSGAVVTTPTAIPFDEPLQQTISIPRLEEIGSLEYVTIKVTIKHANRGALQVSIISPSGTESVIATTRRNDYSVKGFKDWSFSSVQFWGEQPEGTWTVKIEDTGARDKSRGTLDKLEFLIFGSAMTTDELKQRKMLVDDADGSESLGCPSRVTCGDETYDDLANGTMDSFWTLHSYKIMAVVFLFGVASILVVFIVVEVYQKNKLKICSLFGRRKVMTEEATSLLQEGDGDVNDDLTEFHVQVRKDSADCNETDDRQVQQMFRLNTQKDISPAMIDEGQVLEVAALEPEFAVLPKKSDDHTIVAEVDCTDTAEKEVVPTVVGEDGGDKITEVDDSTDVEDSTDASNRRSPQS
jgi:proprotein convertase subtilisin/kexin type 7